MEGRRFERGVREVIVGRKAAQQFAGLGVGSRIAFRDSDWTVVGIFDERRRRPRVRDLGRRRGGHVGVPAHGVPVGHGHGSPTARTAGLAAFEDSVSRDPRFSISVLREPEYYAKQADGAVRR